VCWRPVIVAEPVIEPEPSIEPLPAAIQAASKEEIIEVTPEPSPAASPLKSKEQVLPLAAEPEPVAAPGANGSARAGDRRSGREARRRHLLMQGERRYRIRGLNKNMSYELLK